MAGQGPSRRELLQALALASAASAFPGFSRWNYALAETAMAQHHGDSAQQAPRTPYRPQFFSPGQYASLETLVDLILPAIPHPAETGSPMPILQPGAKEAGVAEFIDFMVSSDPTLQAPFRDGLAWLDQAAAPATSFTSLSREQQNSTLERLAYKAKHREAEQAGQQFFLLLRRYTVMGFYTTRVGLESLDYPGLQFYSASPGCTHAGNPEHIGL